MRRMLLWCTVRSMHGRGFVHLIYRIQCLVVYFLFMGFRMLFCMFLGMLHHFRFAAVVLFWQL